MATYEGPGKCPSTISGVGHLPLCRHWREVQHMKEKTFIIIIIIFKHESFKEQDVCP